MKNTRILHLFQWVYKDILNILEEVREQGFNSILLTPCQPFKNSDCDEWYWVYQPLGLKIGNKYGTKEELQQLCIKAKSIGIKVYMDIIITHMASSDNPMELHKDVDNILSNNKYFWKERKPIRDWNNRWEVTNYCHGMPCIRVDNFDYQDLVINFMKELAFTGINGFRIDSGKAITLYEENRNMFFDRIEGELNKNGDIDIFAEVIYVDKPLADLYCKHTNILTNSFVSDKSKAIVYVESHDSYLDKTIGHTRNMSDNMLLDEYEILFKSGFTNTMFYCRPFNDTWKSERIREINFKYIQSIG